MSNRIKAIEYIRGVAMLGVVGIHTGAYSLTNPFINIHLFALLEIFTRFSVPIFFFVTAFGLFYRHELDKPFDYKSYWRRRFRVVIIPYLVWSFLYMARASIVSGDYSQWSILRIGEYIFFGLASYQLYFLVILIWFYSLMPLWRSLLKEVLAQPVRYLAVILVLQIIFNYYSSYMIRADSAYSLIRALIEYRVSYFPLHYLFIFLLGAVVALRMEVFIDYISSRRLKISMFFAVTLIGMLGSYYWLLLGKGYSRIEVANTIHQLSPIGVLYTLAATLFLMLLFTYHNPGKTVSMLLNSLSRYSYPVYLVHPFFMYFFSDLIAGKGLMMTAPVVIVFYIATVAVSLIFAVLLEATARYVPVLSIALTGTAPKVRKPALAA